MEMKGNPMGILGQFNEFALVNRLTRNLKRHPEQFNKCHRSDAELIKESDGNFLAVTIDTLQEEYQLGILRNPFTLGWCVVAHSLSDLAAVAAEPIGILLALNFPKNLEAEWSDRFFEGVQSALLAHCTFCLGGDTSFSTEPSFTCTALGRVRGPKPLTRVGCKAGDSLYVTGSLGSGNLLGIMSQVDKETWAKLEEEYRPPARLQETILLRNWMRCAIDTSDALLQAMAIISELNQVGIHFDHREDLYEPRLVSLVKKIDFPLWLVNAFGMGEYEILFSVAPETEAAFLEDAKEKGVNVKKIGFAKGRPEITIGIDWMTFNLDVPFLINLFGQCVGINDYLENLVKYDSKLRMKM